MRVRIMGKFWHLRFVPRLGDGKRGDCDRPDVKGKAIRVLSRLKGEEKLEVVIHELLHAADWHASEEFVAEAAEDVARILTRLGLRWEDD